jgi:hypothetical protein
VLQRLQASGLLFLQASRLLFDTMEDFLLCFFASLPELTLSAIEESIWICIEVANVSFDVDSSIRGITIDFSSCTWEIVVDSSNSTWLTTGHTRLASCSFTEGVVLIKASYSLIN